MRPNVDSQKIKRLMQALGREAQGSGCIYFTGGASALLMGWRSSTVDIDICLDPEPPGIFQAIAKIKQELNINIELASPQDFLPTLPLQDCFEAIAPELIRFPSLNPDVIRSRVEGFIERFEDNLEEGQS
jgi:hypothetical protein